jgi:hypothetical protein
VSNPDKVLSGMTVIKINEKIGELISFHPPCQVLVVAISGMTMLTAEEYANTWFKIHYEQAHSDTVVLFISAAEKIMLAHPIVTNTDLPESLCTTVVSRARHLMQVRDFDQAALQAVTELCEQLRDAGRSYLKPKNPGVVLVIAMIVAVACAFYKDYQNRG